MPTPGGKAMYAGVDIGSTTSKAVLVDSDGTVLNFSLIPTSFDRDKSGEDVLAMALDAVGGRLGDLEYIASTGYGRRSFKRSQKVMPEIVCHARGTAALVPGIRTIIDIGGQDSKVIEISEQGAVTKFEMNDKCAAGTGRFFEVLTDRLLNVSLDELGPLALESDSPCVISSVCTIFAESEIISYLSTGRAKKDIAAGMLLSVAKRIIAMGKGAQIRFEAPILFSGGTAKNPAARKIFEDLLKKPVMTIEQPQITAALGVALFARDQAHKEQIERAAEQP